MKPFRWIRAAAELAHALVAAPHPARAQPPEMRPATEIRLSADPRRPIP